MAAVFLALVSGSLTTTGMFMDGLIYSNVAVNMAEGVGSFWHPVYTATHHPDFYEHPPLALGLMALAYRLLGVKLWVTKSYTVLTTLLAAGLMVRLWRRLGHCVATGWVPLLLWTLMPVVTHYAHQAMLDNTMLLFDLGAIMLLLDPQGSRPVAVASESRPKILVPATLRVLLAGVLLAAAFMTKGFVGLFPLALPMLLWWTDRRRASLATTGRNTVLLLAGTLVPLALVALAAPPSVDYFRKYMQHQVLAGWSRGEVHRWQVVVYYLRNVALPLAVVVAVMLCRRRRLLPLPAAERALWLLVACAVLPMMVSTRQHEFYVLPAMPLTAVLLASPCVRQWPSSWVRRRPVGGTSSALVWLVPSLLLAGALTLNMLNYGKPGRDRVLQEDLAIIAPHLQAGETVNVPTPLYYDYKLQGYYYRECRVSLGDQGLHRHLLTTAAYPADSCYREVPLPTEQYHLYELQAE